MFGIIYNNLNSTELCLYVEKKPSIPSIIKKIENIEIEGRHGSLHLDKGYGDVTITIPFGFSEKENFSKKTRQITAWLQNAGNNMLRFTDDYEIFYRVKNVTTSEFTRNMNTIGRFTCTFTVEPFSYLLDGNNTITLTGANTIYNIGTYESEPYIKVYGQGDIFLYVNTTEVQLKDIDDYIEIDTELMQCRKGDLNINNKMIGEFPKLKTGENNISYTGNVNKIEIIPRWRCI